MRSKRAATLQKILFYALLCAMAVVLLVIFVPHGIVGTYLGWRARRAAQGGQHAQD